MKYDKYDLIVVGTGFASTLFLKKYLEKSGTQKKVLVLERGYFYPHRERLKVAKGLHSDYLKYEVPWDKAINNMNENKIWKFSTGFGGSSNCWWGCTPRFMPNDFKMKSIYGVADDWPLDYSDLEKYYYEVEEIMQISGPEKTPFPRTGKYPLPEHRFSVVDKILHKTYGDLYISQPSARASRALKHRNGCIASSSCHTCPVDAKFTIENSDIGVYNDSRVELVYGAEVYRLVTANQTIRNVIYLKEGKDRSVEGEVVVLGANPFFNVNILLNSGDSNPWTGNGFGEQLGMQVHVYLENMKNVGGSNWVNANGYMLYDGEHRKEFAACLIEVNNAPYNIRLERGKHLDIVSLRMVFEDLPLKTNYISNSSNKLIPEVQFKERSSYTMKAVDNMKKVLPEILSCLPVEDLKFFSPEPNEGHIIGGTRMSVDHKSGVVDKNLIHHQYRNLFVLGSGAFTTFGASNPTLTLSALSLLAADRNF